MTAIALWNIVSAFLGNITVDSMIARLGMASACVANLFSGHRSIRMLLFVVAVILIIAATVIYIHNANNV
nr:hypothetical protein [Phocaeicola dorei]